MLDTNTEVEEEMQQPATNEDVDPHDNSTFVPVVARKLSEEDTIRKTVQERQILSSSHLEQIVPWPKSGNTSINEFITEGYILCAFPTLFPTGAGDYVAPRHHNITAGNYFKHLIKYGEGQFAKHPRWRALQTGRVYIHQHPLDACLTLDDLRDMVGREGELFANRVLHFASSLCGTSQLVQAEEHADLNGGHPGNANSILHTQFC